MTTTASKQTRCRAVLFTMANAALLAFSAYVIFAFVVPFVSAYTLDPDPTWFRHGAAAVTPAHTP